MYFHLTLLSILSLFSVNRSIDWWDVLSTDLSCCSTHSNAQDCSNEGANACSFVDDSVTCAPGKAGKECRFKQRLADEFGACLQESFIACKVAAGKINACCAPGCKGIDPPAGPPPAGQPPASGVAPVCFPKVTPAPVTPAPVTPAPVTPRPTTPRPTTPSPTTPRPTTPEPTPQPTPQPTPEECVKGVNYDITGYPCQISGDPHTKKVQGGKHDFQGQPKEKNPDGEWLKSFYYVAPCNGYSSADMPYSIMATHYHWGHRPVSGIDYFTLELTEPDGSKIYVYASSELRGYSKNAAATKDYDVTDAAGLVTPLISNVPTQLGTRFLITYKYVDYKKATFTLKIDDDEEKKVYFMMQGQMNRESDIHYGTGSTRYRMHYVYLTTPNKYKCMACGLCGDYSGDASTSQLKLCDGRVETVRQGWDGTKTPEAYDIFGLTYEYNYYNDMCTPPNQYDITKNTESLNYVDPCNQNIAEAVKDKCQEIRDANLQCCNTVIGGTVCADLQEDCEFDACVIASDNGGSTQDIADAVDSVMGDAISAACNIDDIGEAMNAGNTLKGTYLGCYKDDTNRRFEWPSGRVHNIANHNTAECVRVCVDLGYKYMGLQYDKECFCGNDLSTITNLGLRDPNEGQCGMNQQNTPEYNAFGCWGGSWTNCVYDISDNLPADKRLMVNNNNNYLLDDSAINNNNNNNMIQMGVIGGIVLIGAFGLVYKRYYDNNIKDGKYIPIRDDAKV